MSMFNVQSSKFNRRIMNAPTNITKTRASKAFTLIELLMVVTIILALMGMSFQFGNAWKAGTLAAQARQLSAEFSQATLLAQKDNLPVEFRFYLAPDEFDDGNIKPRAFQIVRLKGYEPGSLAPIYQHLSDIRFFEDDIILHASAEYTSLMNVSPHPPGPNDPKLRGSSRSYYSFLFLPNGTTSLPRNQQAVFTLVKEGELKTSTSLPPNYRSVVLQPATANSTVF